MTANSENMARADTAPRLRLGYRHYVLAVLVFGYVINVVDRTIMGILIQPIKGEFNLSDTQLGFLGGIAFALFYATLGIPIAALADRTSRTKVLSAALIVWSVMTALCGLAAGFVTLLLARVGTAVGEAGGSPPSHSLIADYFPTKERATALSIFALGVPIGVSLGSLLGGWGSDLIGWRMTFILAGVPGIIIGLLVLFTMREPARGGADGAAAISRAATSTTPPIRDVLSFLWKKPSFRHLSLAAALHSAVWYGGSTWNAPFFIRSHAMSASEAGSWLALFAGIATIGTLLGGVLADRLSVRFDDKRWYLWVPGIATLVMVPFQFLAYLSADMAVVAPSFAVMVVLASVFFGPSFAMTQGLVTLRMRAVAASVLLFVQTLIGLGMGPFVTGILSDALGPSYGNESLRYALVIIGLANIWAAFHYFAGARTLRADLTATASVDSE
jgi:predicted MFS family arabinose efflux permease